MLQLTSPLCPSSRGTQEPRAAGRGTPLPVTPSLSLGTPLQVIPSLGAALGKELFGEGIRSIYLHLLAAPQHHGEERRRDVRLMAAG